MSRTIVVGGSGTIGRVVVDRLVAEEHEVLVVGRGERALEDTADGRASVTTASIDVTTDDAGARLTEAIGDDRVRMLVHMASAPLGGDILGTETSVIRTSVEVKVIGLLRLVRALEDRFDDNGRIVAVGGNLGFDPVPHASTAGIANAALANVVRQLNRRLAPDVTCHLVAPGPVDTDRYRVIAREEAAQRGITEQDVVQEAGEQAPLGRLTSQEEVAWAIARLADAEAAALAGSTLFLDAGRRTAIP